MDPTAERLSRRDFGALAESAAQNAAERLGFALTSPGARGAALLDKTYGFPFVAFADGTLGSRDPRAYTIADHLGIVDQAVAAGRLVLTASQEERHRSLKRHRAKRRLRAAAYFSEWERNRESDIAHTLRVYGADSPSLAAAKRALRLARATRRREEAHAARVLAGCLASPLRVRAVGQQRRPRRRGAGRPRAQASRSSARSGDSGADGPGEPPPAAPRLALAPPARTIHCHALSRCPSCGAVLLWSNGRLVCASRSCTRWGRPA